MAFDFHANLGRIYPFVFVLVFWGILVLPLLKPDVSLKSLGSDFRGHGSLIEGINNLRLTMGDRVFLNVLVGKDGWLFYTGDRSMDDYQGTNPFTSIDLRDMRDKFDALNGQLKQKGITLIVVIAPNKSTIYPEYMPDQIKKTGGISRLDQFVDYMHMYGRTRVVDLRPDLIKASKTEQVFYKTNTHWNPFGQYIAYTTTLTALSERFPELQPHPLSDYKELDNGLKTQDIPPILGTPNIKEDAWILQPRFETGVNSNLVPLPDGKFIQQSWNTNQNLPSALIYNDSFFNTVIPFLVSHFRQTTSIPGSSVPSIWTMKWVDQVHPDIVIIEYAERFLNDNFIIPNVQ